MNSIFYAHMLGTLRHRDWQTFLAALAVLLCASESARAQTCDPVPSGIVSWWAGENNALDNMGLNNGAPVNSPTYATGEVGYAFSFNGSDQCIFITNSPSLQFTNALTIEAWVYPTQSSSASSILVKYDGVVNVNQSSFSFSLIGTTLYLTLSSDGVPSHNVQLNSTGSVPLSTWTHVAGTYDGSTISLYINGALDSTLAYTGGIFAGTDNMAIGANVGGFPFGSMAGPFGGMIDEVAIYSRALSAAEILGLYNADFAGKCPMPPTFLTQPANQSVFVGTSVSFSATAAGSQPLVYQWEFDGSPISGATNLTLSLTNVTTANAGNYSLLLSNSYNTALSSNAALQVRLVNFLVGGKPLTNAQYTFTNSATVQMTNYYTNGYIFYTLDGSTPTPSSTLYSAPVVLTSNCTLRALGYSSDFQQSSLSGPVSIMFPPIYTLSVTTAGGGSVALNPAGSNEVSGTVVTLTATPSNGWTFLQWLGDAAGFNASNTVTMDRNKSVTAVFGTTVSSAVGGNGSVIFYPPAAIYPFGTVLQASAIPQSGNEFVFWGDAAAGNANPLAFAVTNANPEISALFTTLSGGQVALAVVPVGHGTVGINPQANTYATGTSVTITATPNTNHAFIGWSGSASGSSNPLTVQLNQSETIYANFTTNDSLLVYPVTSPGTADGIALDLYGELGTHYRLDTSSNLVNWTTLYDLTNDVGTIHYIDSSATNLSHRFYHAVILTP